VRRSIQGRLVVGTIGAAALVLALAGSGLYLLVRASLRTEFDLALTGKVRALATFVEEDEDRVEFELDRSAMPEFERRDHPEYFELWLADGRALQRSSSLQENDLPFVTGAPEQVICRSVTLPHDRPGRLAALTFGPRRGNEDDQAPVAPAPSRTAVTLAVARDTAELDQTLLRLALLLACVGAGAIFVQAVVLAWIVRRRLRPLRGLASRIGELNEADLAARVVLDNVPAELQPVVQRLNDLLEKLEVAFARERSFNADVAHELRTPLAGLRATFEVSLSKPRSPDEYRNALTRSLEIATQMHAMVENLLWLGRAEAGQIALEQRPVPLEALLRECWEPFAVQAQQRGLHVTWRSDAVGTLETDRERLRQALSTIFDNAATHADSGGTIVIEARAAAQHVCVIVSNTGSQLAPQDAPRVFDRFWRGDAARHATGVHCGLGLSIAQKTVRLLGGAISATATADGVFRIRIEMPRG